MQLTGKNQEWEACKMPPLPPPDRGESQGARNILLGREKYDPGTG